MLGAMAAPYASGSGSVPVMASLSAVVLACLELALAAVLLLRMLVLVAIALTSRVLPCEGAGSALCWCPGQRKQSQHAPTSKRRHALETEGGGVNMQSCKADRDWPAPGRQERDDAWPPSGAGEKQGQDGAEGVHCWKGSMPRQRAVDCDRDSQSQCTERGRFALGCMWCSGEGAQEGARCQGVEGVCRGAGEERSPASVTVQEVHVDRSLGGLSLKLRLAVGAVSSPGDEAGPRLAGESPSRSTLRHQLSVESNPWQVVEELQHELEEERKAAEVAAAEALGMITRLQNEKAALQTSLRQAAQLEQEQHMQRDALVEVLEGVVASLDQDRAALQRENAHQRERLARVAAGWQPGCAGFMLVDPWSRRNGGGHKASGSLQGLLRSQSQVLVQGAARGLLLPAPENVDPQPWSSSGKKSRKAAAPATKGEGRLPDTAVCEKSMDGPQGTSPCHVHQTEDPMPQTGGQGPSLSEPGGGQTEIHGIGNVKGGGKCSQLPTVAGATLEHGAEPEGAICIGSSPAARLQCHVSLVSHPVYIDEEEETAMDTPGIALQLTEGQAEAETLTGATMQPPQEIRSKSGLDAGTRIHSAAGGRCDDGLMDKTPADIDPPSISSGAAGRQGPQLYEADRSCGPVKQAEIVSKDAAVGTSKGQESGTSNSSGGGSITQEALETHIGQQAGLGQQTKGSEKSGSKGSSDRQMQQKRQKREQVGGADELAEKLAARRSLLEDEEAGEEAGPQTPQTPPLASPVSPEKSGGSGVRELSGELAGKLASRRKWEQLWAHGGEQLWKSPSVAIKGGPKEVRRALFSEKEARAADGLSSNLDSIGEGHANGREDAKPVDLSPPSKEGTDKVTSVQPGSKEAKAGPPSSTETQPLSNELAEKLASRRKWET